jgi:hypothetical protein
MKNRFVHRLFGLACLSLLLGGCSTRSWYEGMRLGAEGQCEKQPPGAREDCLARLNKQSFEAYDKERKAQD